LTSSASYCFTQIQYYSQSLSSSYSASKGLISCTMPPSLTASLRALVLHLSISLPFSPLAYSSTLKMETTVPL
jgi:hypothetical protein